MAQPALSRTFRDMVGVEWTAREIAGPELTGKLATLLEHDRRRGGWLVFESAEGEKRRLVPYPPDWRTISDFELERWCMRAHDAARVMRKRSEQA